MLCSARAFSGKRNFLHLNCVGGLFIHQITSIFFFFTVTSTTAFHILRSSFCLVALADAGNPEARSGVLCPACTSAGRRSFLHLHCLVGYSLLSTCHLSLRPAIIKQNLVCYVLHALLQGCEIFSIRWSFCPFIR